MFLTIKTIWYMVVSYFQTLGLFRRGKKMPEQERWQKGHDYLLKRCPGLFKASNTRIVYHGLENIPEKKGLLFVGNHQSYFDIPILLSVMPDPTGFVSKIELNKVPFVGNMLHMIGSVPMDRGNLRQNLEAIRETAERLTKGLNMVIFPEGTRAKGPNMGEFKKGSLRAATMSGATVVPFRIQDAYKIFEGNHKLKITPAKVDVYFGEPIDLCAMPKKEQRELMENIKEVIQALK